MTANALMKVTFYGKLATVLGRELQVAVDAPCTIAGLRRRIAKARPEAGPSLEDGRVRACVGGRLVPDDHALEPSDEVAFLAPVSGG